MIRSRATSRAGGGGRRSRFRRRPGSRGRFQPPARRAASLAARQGPTAGRLDAVSAENEYHIRDTTTTSPCRRTSGCPGGTSGNSDRARLEAFERDHDRDRPNARRGEGRAGVEPRVRRGVLAACARAARTTSSPPTGGCTTRWRRRRIYSTTASATTRSRWYKRPTDLAMLRDVPVSCNVCVNDVLEDGLLAAASPSFRHAHDRLLMPDAIVPSSAQVMVMPVEMRTRTCRGRT